MGLSPRIRVLEHSFPRSIGLCYRKGTWIFCHNDCSSPTAPGSVSDVHHENLPGALKEQFMEVSPPQDFSPQELLPLMLLHTEPPEIHEN